MQISSPLFLFLFLPLSLPILPLCKKKHRKTVMSLISIAFLLLANWGDPWAFLPIGAILALICTLVCLPAEIFSRLRLLLGVSVPLAILVAARLAAEYFPEHHTYPTGLALVTLGAISICIDRYRADAMERETPLSVIGYLLFFPTVTLGPVLRYKQYLYLTEHAEPKLENFSAGAMLYLKGYLKRIAVCTILFASLESILSVLQHDALLPLSVFLLALLLSFLALYFTVSGITDMSRGLMSLYGYTPPRGQGRFFLTPSSHRMLGSLLCSLDAFLDDYLATPLKRLFPGKWGKMLAAILVCACTALFYRTTPSTLIVALPLLISAVALAQGSRYLHRPHKAVLRIPFAFFSSFLLSLFALAMMLDEPLILFDLIVGVFQKSDPLALYHALLSFTYLNHLLVLLIFLLVYAPLSLYLPRLIAKCPLRVQNALQYTGAILALVAFLLALIFLLPQFPQYAELVYGKPLA